METSSKSHIGRKILRIRELKGMKQEALAFAMGVSQQTISHIENSAEVDESKLNKIAEALGVSPDAIRNFSEEGVINYFNTFTDNALSNSTGAFSHACTFNPLDKMMELVEKNEKLYRELVEVEREKVRYLERLLGK